MKCSHCGRINRSTAITCRYCGAALIPYAAAAAVTRSADGASQDNSSASASAGTTAPAAISTGVKAKRKRGAWLWALLAVLLLAAAAYAVFFTGSSIGRLLPGAKSYTLLDSEYGITVLNNGRDVLPGVVIDKAETSVDGRTVGVLGMDKKLYCCRGGRTADVDANIKDFVMADGGGSIFYIDSAGKLFTFNCKKKDALPVCLCNDAIMPNFAVSPEGKYVLFNRVSDGALYLCTVANGKEAKLDGSLTPIALTDSAKYIYAYSEDDCSLYLLNKRSSASCLRGGVGESIWFNYDHSEMVYTSEAANGNIKTLVCRNGVEYEASGCAAAPILSVSMVPHVRTAEGFSIVTCPVKSFDGRLMGGDGLMSFGFEGSTPLGTSTIESAVQSDDLKELYYISDGKLWRAASADIASSERLSEDCAAFRIGRNGKAVWFLDSVGSLYCINASSTVRVYEGVTELCVSPNGREVLFLAGGEVCYCKLSSLSKVKPLGVRADGVRIDANGMYVLTGGKWQGVTRSGKLYGLFDEEDQ